MCNDTDDDFCCEHCGSNIPRDDFWVDQDTGLLGCPDCGEDQTEGR